MSKTAREIADMEALRADFDQFLCENDELNAGACIDRMGESYSELEALKMHQEFNAKFSQEPREHFEVEEDRAMERDVEIYSSPKLELLLKNIVNNSVPLQTIRNKVIELINNQ